jgi:hypothetical protein
MANTAVIIKRLGQALAAFGENFVLHKSVVRRFPNFARYFDHAFIL